MLTRIAYHHSKINCIKSFYIYSDVLKLQVINSLALCDQPAVNLIIIRRSFSYTHNFDRLVNDPQLT